MDPVQLLCANLILVLAASVQGVLGFGVALLSAPLLNIIDPGFVPVPIILSGLVLALLVGITEHSAFSVAAVKWPIAGNWVGAALGGTTLALLTPRAFQLLFSLLVMLAVVLSAFKAHLRRSARNGLLVGLVSGYMGVTTSISGPPVALYFHALPADQLRANLSGFFVAAAIVALGAVYLAGMWGWQETRLFLSIQPGLVVGFIISRTLIRRYRLHNLRQWVLIFVGLIAAATFWDAL